MTVTKGFITGAATTALDTRKADASKLVSNADGSPRIGVLTSNPSIVTSDASTAPMRVAIATAGFATQRSAGDGVAHWTNDGSVFVTVTKPGSQSWIVTVYAKHDDTVAGDADNLPVIGVVTGTAAAIPTVEGALPAGATKLATIVVPSTATSTQSAGVVITNVYPMTALTGGFVPFRTLADLLAWTNPTLFQEAAVIADGTAANNGQYYWDGTRWVGHDDIDLLLSEASTAPTPSVAPGATTAIRTASITLPVAKRVRIVLTGYLQVGVAGTNAAGYIKAPTIDGVIAATGQADKRWVTLGAAGNTPIAIRHEVVAIIPTGTHSIVFNASSDGGSGGTVFFNAVQMEVWAD